MPDLRRRLHRGRWFIGGPGSAFHPNGAYIDPPTHQECAAYALRVCPYLAAPRYASRLDDALVDYERLPPAMMFLDQTMDPRRPDCFVAVMAIGQTVNESGYVSPKRPYRRVQVWRLGDDVTSPSLLAELMRSGGAEPDYVAQEPILLGGRKPQ